jgi:hypothetical protein
MVANSLDRTGPRKLAPQVFKMHLESDGASLWLANVGTPVQHGTLVQVVQRDLLEDRNPSRVSLK